MEKIYNENFNITMNAVYDSLQRLGISDYVGKANEGSISFCHDSLKLLPFRGKTKIISENDNSFMQALLEEIDISLGEER